jgi:hypothetical protein
MRLLRVKPIYFRGFGNSDWMDTDSDLVLLYGPNAFAKTSLAEAMEWLFFGSTKRRARGDKYSKEEYKGSYRNAHAPASTPTSVAAYVRLRDGSEHLIERRLVFDSRQADDTSETYVDGSLAGLDSIGVLPDEAFYPIIVQHGLQDFIHTRPIDRRNAISAALGLDPLVEFKTVLDRARIALRNSPPPTVSVSLSSFRGLLAKLAQNADLAALHQGWSSNQFNPAADERDLLQASLSALGWKEGDWESVRQGLGDLRDRAAASVFDDACIRPPYVLQANLDQLDKSKTRSGETAEPLRNLVGNFLGVAASTYAMELLRFWQAGLGLVDAARPEKCPMCEADTLTAEKREELEERIRQNKDYSEALEALKSEARSAAEWIESLRRATQALFPAFLDAQARVRLEALLQGYPGVLKGFLAAHDVASQTKAGVNTSLESLKTSVPGLPGQAQKKEGAEEARRIADTLGEQVASHLELARNAASNYAVAFQRLEALLQQSVSSQDAVRKVDALIAAHDGWRDMVAVAAYEKLLADTLEEVRAVEEFIQKKQAELMSTRGREAKEWFDLMYPGASVTFAEMEPATDAIKLHAESFGVRIAAAACLSTSQLNCLGLSVHLMRATCPTSPFGFVVIDDPVQSMDEDHCESFIINVMPRLLDTHRRQVFLFSHLQSITDRVRETNSARKLLYYRIEDYRQTGPVVRPHVPLKREFKDLRQLACGNEQHRELAVDRLRVVTERLIRELYLVETGTPLGPEYSDATAPRLLKVFRGLPGTTPAEHQRLQDTVRFSDPAHHTEVGWQPPTTQQIEPHIQRLQQIAKQRGLPGEA